MIMAHLFWALLLAACVVWYSTITLYVSLEGMRDIRTMLKQLSQRETGTGDTPRTEHRLSLANSFADVCIQLANGRIVGFTQSARIAIGQLLPYHAAKTHKLWEWPITMGRAHHSLGQP